MATVVIPGTIRQATRTLTNLDKIVQAQEWERAAIVAAYVRLQGSGGARDRGQTGALPFETAGQFAQRGIPGLRSEKSVRTYVQRWLDANDGDYPVPGKRAKLPTGPWPPDDANIGSRLSGDPERAVDQLVEKHGERAVAEAIVSRPRVDTAVSEARIDRISTPQDRADLEQRGQQMSDNFERERAEGLAGMADHIQHEATLGLYAARTFLRKAAAAKEQYSYFSPTQREEFEHCLGECEVLIGLLRGESWSDADREFLASISEGD